jgi:hypothetical protein
MPAHAESHATPAPDPGVLSDAEFEAIVKDFWDRREPGYEDVTLIVYRAGRAVRTLLLGPGKSGLIRGCPGADLPVPPARSPSI